MVFMLVTLLSFRKKRGRVFYLKEKLMLYN